MRQPFFSLDDQRITECDGDGLSWPDDIVDEALISSLPVLDDAFLEALGIDCSPPAPMDMDVDVWVTQSPAAGPKTNSSGDHQYSTPSASSSRRSLSSTTSSWEPSPGSASPYRRWDVPTKPRRQPAAVRKRPWSHPSLSFGVPALHEAPADLDGHGVGAVNVGEFCYDIDSKPSKFSYGGSKLGHGNNVGDSGIGHRRSTGRQRDQPEGQRCGHCHVTETPQWRNGPDGPGTLCNACGIRYRMGSDKLVPEYRPSTSPFFRSGEHSNRNSKVQKLREKKVKALKLYGDGGGSGAPGGTLTPAKVADNVDTNSIL